MKMVHYSINAFVTLLLGLLLARWISGLPYEFSLLPGLIASAIRLFGMDTIENADDIETIGLLVIIVASVMVMAIPVAAANLIWRRWRNVR
ncbi:hypothetical protein RvVAR0630_28880 [Agrobacterium vitis]|uniref:hypothetical protein n=1 Tax=Agrobacterium vitis TaxID=373 RepID=UPI0015D8F298|nr:hypothetical protein [Agrobacterium vitis]BCH60264.1 hypothetical protein RvVAR0630_28880 [Agrobacterium vitis]